MTQVLKPIFLIVEDEHLIRMLAVQAFLDDGFLVLEAEHAAAALLAYGKDARIQVLFTDINMPGDMNGIDLAESLKVLSPNIQVIITSALPLVRPIDGLRGTFVRKPYDIEEVCRTERTLLAA